MSRTQVRVQLKMLGIEDRRTYIRIFGRVPFNDPVITLEFARRKIAEKQKARA